MDAMREYESAGALGPGISSTRVHLRRRRPFGPGRRLVAWLLWLAAVALLWVALHPRKIEVNGSRVTLRRASTVEALAQELRLPTATGNLLDVRGGVLRQGAGKPAEAWRNGVPVALNAQVEPGDRLVISPAGDLREPVVDRITYLDSPAFSLHGEPLPQIGSAPYVPGLQRERHGAYSGLPLSYGVTYASAQVNRTAEHLRAKSVALTFDDGPNTVWTPQVLATLKRYGAKGTFFVLGQAVKPMSSVFRRTLAEGHEVGTHSWHHDQFTRMSPAAMRADLERCLKAMQSEGAQVRWFRPPYGAHNKQVDQVAQSLGLHVALWDIDPMDWKRPGADAIYQRIMRHVTNHCIILMHDGPQRREQTVAALNRIIPDLQARGYDCLTLSEVKGLVPIYTGVVDLRVDGRHYRLEPLSGDWRVLVDGKPLILPLRPLRWQAEILVPARTVGERLGARLEYDKATETLTVSGDGGTVVFRLDSLTCELDGKTTPLLVPAILCNQQALVPLSILKRVCAASATVDQLQHEVRLHKPSRI
jgi:peptidoglycan/xylan/chitin deacetylase (PgdA/CDA1 family)